MAKLHMVIDAFGLLQVGIKRANNVTASILMLLVL